MIGIFSSGVWRIPQLENFLAQPCRKLSVLRPIPSEIDAIAVWGHRPSAAKSVALAKAAGKSVIRLEEGFIRSLDPGVNSGQPLSIVVDDIGIYYDANQPSALETLIQDKTGNAALAEQAHEAMQNIVADHLLNSNQVSVLAAGETLNCERVLVLDQSYNDVSVTYGNASTIQKPFLSTK